MEARKTKLDGVLLITSNIFEDFRGAYIETYVERELVACGVNVHFVCDAVSVSSYKVLRGLHGDKKTWKLASCGLGRLYFVVLNCTEGLPQYGMWESFILTDTNRLQVLVPPGYANGHLILSEKGMFCYKQSEYYDREGQFTVRFDDPRFKIWWPIKDPILSQRDDEVPYVGR